MSHVEGSERHGALHAAPRGSLYGWRVSQVGNWSGLRAVPKDRILTETDHPFGDRREASPQRPGNVEVVERRLGEILGIPSDDVRRLIWQNLRRLTIDVGVHDLLPHQFQVQMLAS